MSYVIAQYLRTYIAVTICLAIWIGLGYYFGFCNTFKATLAFIAFLIWWNIEVPPLYHR